MSVRRVLALSAFALRTNGRSRLTRAGLLVGLLILLLGPLLSLGTGAGWRMDRSLAFYGVLVALIFCLRSGLEQQRASDLDVFLTHNLVTPIEHAVGLVLSLLAAWVLLCGVAFLALLAASGGDPATAAWYTAAWGLRAAVALGFVPLVERFASLRTPFLLPALGYFALLVTLAVLVGEDRAIEILVITRRDDPASLLRLAGHAGITLVITVGAFVALAAVEPWWRGGRRKIVPIRHGPAPPRL